MQVYALCGRVILWGVLNKEKALHPPPASAVFFISYFRIQTAFDAPFEIKNPGTFVPGLFLCSGM